tara:strand:- start:197 stop:535 length:339 start_codon:yes stop_codon:yes gene_type:complete
MREPSKIKYVSHPKYGNFEAPKIKDTTDAKKLSQNYKKRLEFEKYLNPKGLKPTITSRFEKPPTQIEFLNHEILLHRNPKPYEKNVVSFRCSPYLSKPEIKQYLSKVYNLPI